MKITQAEKDKQIVEIRDAILDICTNKNAALVREAIVDCLWNTYKIEAFGGLEDAAKKAAMETYVFFNGLKNHMSIPLSSVLETINKTDDNITEISDVVFHPFAK